jgi:gamma-glutamylcyclotransferase (GGCT)/AIG2-like uncharacterized protein YtfP
MLPDVATVIQSNTFLTYFAYGSNLWPEQMHARLGELFKENELPTGFQSRVATLPHHRVNFSMLGSDGSYYANVVPAQGEVLGVLYHLNPRALEILDLFEGGYQRQLMQVYDATNTEFEAVVYVAKTESLTESGKPDFEYLQRILRGGMHHGLPVAYLRSIEETAQWV